MRTRPVILLLVALIATGAASAVAAPDPETAKARALYKQAEIHFSMGELDRALELYKEAYKIKPLPGFLFNMGQCHRHLGDFKRALFLYQQYLHRLPSAPNRGEVKKLIEICESRLAKAPDQASPPPTPPASTPIEDPPLSALYETAPPRRPATSPPPRVERGRRRLSPAWFWSGVGLSGALLVTGTVTGVLALNSSSEYKDSATPIARRRDLKDTGETLTKVSTATFAAAGAAAAATVLICFFTDFRSRETAVSAAALPGGGAVVVGGWF